MPFALSEDGYKIKKKNREKRKREEEKEEEKEKKKKGKREEEERRRKRKEEGRERVYGKGRISLIPGISTRTFSNNFCRCR
ncbi:MAG: hypothetical protein LBK75_10625 [Oscillospiraceae bacterium]|nr:hypothetical protein [Oscillospiraceae bacterium]